MGKYNEFEKELTHLINKHSLENGSDTPDYLLARILVEALENYERAITRLKAWKS